MYRLTIDIDPFDPMEIIFAQFFIALRKAREMAEQDRAEEEFAMYCEQQKQHDMAHRADQENQYEYCV